MRDVDGGGMELLPTNGIQVLPTNGMPMMVLDSAEPGQGDALDGMMSISFGPETDPAMQGTLGPLPPLGILESVPPAGGKGEDVMGVQDLRSILGGATGNSGPISSVPADPFLKDVVDAMDAS